MRQASLRILTANILEHSAPGSLLREIIDKLVHKNLLTYVTRRYDKSIHTLY